MWKLSQRRVFLAVVSLLAVAACQDGTDVGGEGLRQRWQRVTPPLLFGDSSTLRVLEGGGVEPLEFRLAIDAAAPVTIDISTGPDLQTNVPQTVLESTTDRAIIGVSGTADEDVEGLEWGMISLHLTSDDAEFDGMDVSWGPIKIIDDDLPWIEAGTATAATEGGAAGMFAMRPGVDPLGSVTFMFTAPDGQVMPLPPSRSVSSMNWQVSSQVGFNAVDDRVREPPLESTVQVVVRDDEVPARWQPTVIDEIVVPVIDDDPPALRFPDELATSLPEGMSFTHRVALAQPPTAPVTVAVTSTADVNVSPPSLTFTVANWASPQSFQVLAFDDAIDEDDEVFALAYRVTSDDSGYDGIAVNGLSVTVQDDDTAGFELTEAGPDTAVTEGGPADLYTIRLTSQPSASVRVDAAASGLLSLSPSSLTFSAADWSSPKTVQVSAPENNEIAATNPSTVTITHSVTTTASRFMNLRPRDVAVRVTDNDSAALLSSSPSSISLVEGRSQSFDVRLSAQPASDQTLQLRSSDPRVLVTPSTMPIARTRWQTPITVTVTAAENDLDEPELSAEVTITVSGGFAAPPLTIAVEVTDNDDLEIIATDVEVRETDLDGAAPAVFASFPLRLSRMSTRPITVEWETVDGSALAVADYVVGSGQVTFMPGQTEATAIVDIVSDNAAEPVESFALGLDTSTEGVTLRQSAVSCTITDDDAAPVASTVTLRTAPGVPVMGTFRATDADGDALTYSVVEAPTAGTIQILDPAQGTFSYTPDATAEGQDLLRYAASDGTNTSAPAFVTIDIGEPTGDVAVSLFAPPRALEGERVRLEAIPTGAEPATATYRWDLDGDGDFDDGFDSSVEAVAPGDRASWAVAVRLTDGAREAMDATTIEVANQPPTLSGSNSVEGFEGVPLLLAVTAVDPGGDALTFHWTFGDGDQLDGERLQHVVHTFGNEGFYNVALRVTDSEDAESTFDIFVPVANLPPTLSARPLRRAVAGMPYMFEALAFDPGSEVLTWGLMGPPAFALEPCEDQGRWVCRRVMADSLTAQDLAAGISLSLEVSDGVSTVSLAWRIDEREVDSDNGGAENTCEVRYNLDPSNPTDDLSDPDGDGVPTWIECASGTDPTVSNAPSSPSPLFPVDGETHEGFPVAMLIRNATDPDADPLLYTFELLDAEQRTLSVVEDVPEQPSQSWAYAAPSALVEDGTYWWRARARDAWTVGPWSDLAQFVFSERNDPPSTPTLVGPLGRSSVSPAFRLSPSVDPEGDPLAYEIEVYPIVGSGGLKATVQEQGGEVSWTPAAPFVVGQRWMWRARAVDGQGAASEFSDYFEFEVAPDVADLPVPQPTSPIDGARLSAATEVELVWQNVELAEGDLRYNIVLGRVGVDDPMIVNDLLPAEGATTSWNAGTLEVGAYEWRVQASDGAAVGPLSEVASFEVVDGEVSKSPPGVTTEFGCQVAASGRSSGMWWWVGLGLVVWGIWRRR